MNRYIGGLEGIIRHVVGLQRFPADIDRFFVSAQTGIRKRKEWVTIKISGFRRRLRFEQLYHHLVNDSGVGIDEQQKEILFDAFYTTKAKGMGMGLSISRSIVEDHGGILWSADNSGKGATFSFTIPIYEETEK